jgi:hypothetical protein
VSRSKSEEHWFEEFRRLNAAGESPELPPSEPPPPKDRRRRHPRFDLDDARLFLYEDGLLATIGVGKKNLAQAPLDLSEGGLRVHLRQRIKPGTKVKIYLEIEKHSDAVEATGVVRWCFESARKAGEFFAGIMFTDLHESKKRKIMLMRDWFTSPQFRALKAARRSKLDAASELSFPK